MTLLSGSKKANGISVLMLTTLGAKKGTEITLQVEGEDEEEVFEILDDMFANSFHEE